MTKQKRILLLHCKDVGTEGLGTKELLDVVRGMGGFYGEEEVGRKFPSESILDVDDIQEAYIRLEKAGVIEQDRQSKIWRLK